MTEFNVRSFERKQYYPRINNFSKKTVLGDEYNMSQYANMPWSPVQILGEVKFEVTKIAICARCWKKFSFVGS
jgi:hypothetical protein